MLQDITIILEESIHAQAYRVNDTDIKNDELNIKGTLVHRTEFEEVEKLIRKFIPKKGEKEKKNLHNTITVLGTRGSGKTSFLLTIKEILSQKETLGNNIEILDIIDPTLIEEKGHVFLNVIAVIKNLIDRKLDHQECNPLDNKSSYNRKEWRNALNKLAAGLPSIDGIGNNSIEGWQDPEFVMDIGLKAVDASQKLADNFNIFLSLSLKILDKKAFLLMFDDIDVDARKGWAVLETIRKYFTGSQLITIVSGDSQLYSTVVRQNKWKNFGREILQYEGEQLIKLEVFNDMITELESQYLQKILQPKNRVHLPTIGNCIRYDREKKFYIYETLDDYSIIKKTKEEKGIKKLNEISNIYTRILQYFGINNSYQASSYKVFLLELPLRSQIQFLSIFHINSGKLSTNIISLTDIFLSDLYAKGIDTNTIIKSPKNLNRLILKFLLKERRLEELYQLQPITTEDNLNASLLSLNFLLSYNIQNDPYLIFDYLIKIGYTRNLLPLLGYKSSTEDITTYSIEDLCNNTVILNDNVLKDVVGKIIAYMRGTIDGNSNSEKISFAGTIPLFGLESRGKKGKKVNSDRIDSVLKSENANYVEQMLVYMPLSSNQYVYKQFSLLTYSPYLLFGAIGELLRKVDMNDIKNGFSELSQFRGYMMPDFKKGSNKDEIDNIEEDSQYFPDRQPLDFDIEKAFTNWRNNFPGDLISVHLLGKIATRFFYALTNLESKVGEKKLGDVFHAYILTFMNAVLVEDCRENANDLASDLNLNNTNYANKIFLDNINKLIDISDKKNKKIKSEKLSLSQWILSCPLLLVYLRKDETLKDRIQVFCGGKIEEGTFEINLFKFFDKIPIRENKNNDTDDIKNIDKLNDVSTKINNAIPLFKINYEKVYDILTKNEFNINTLKNILYKDLVVIFNKMGISSVSRPNLRRFIRYINKE